MVMDILISVILLFVGIAALVLIHVCIVWKAYMGSYDNCGGGTKTMSNEDLKKLPCFEYKVGEAEKGSVTSTSTPVDCVVCLENLRVGDNCRLLPNCKHTFHAQCIDSWLLTTPNCPICRTNAKTGMVLKEASGVSSDAGIQVTQNTVLSQTL